MAQLFDLQTKKYPPRGQCDDIGGSVVYTRAGTKS